VILAALADEQIPAQTIAPKFTGRFNKGVDYRGDIAQFEKEFSEDLAIIRFAISAYGLPPTLKLSVHSGSDKFSLYPVMRRGLGQFNAGVHLKTAGTTWLEELIGLAEAGGEGLGLARDIYSQALPQIDELCAPYAAVIDINRQRLPPAAAVNQWSSDQFVAALRHKPNDPSFNPHFRQLLHVAYKVAGRIGPRFVGALEANQSCIARNVTSNLLERHIKPLFL
jgi:tagaturonate epimerase